MPTPTYTLIASSTVGSGGASSIDFSSIPSTYTDLLLKFSLRSATTEIWTSLKFNNATTNFSLRWIQGNGSAVNSNTFSVNSYMAFNDQSSDTANTFSNGEIYIPNYLVSQNKSFSSDFVNENNATSAFAQLQASLWSNTSAINQVTLVPLTGNYAQYSSAYLYGISKS